MHGTFCGSTRHGTDSLVGRVAPLVTFATLGVAFGALPLGVEYFWIAFPVGFGTVMPLAVGLARRRAGDDDRRRSRGDRRGDGRRSDARAGDNAALSTLRERYAAGEIDEEEFERRVEGLLSTEDRR